MKLRVDTLLIKLQYLMLTGIVLTTVLQMNSLASAMFVMTFFLTVGFWIAVAERKIGELSLWAILIIFISCICFLVNALITNAPLSFSYIKKIIMFWATVIFFATMCEYVPEWSVVQFIFRLNTLTALFLIAMYFLITEDAYVYNGRITTYLTFRFTNPNLTAVFLLSICTIEQLCALASKKRIKKLFHIILAATLIYFIVLTRSRTALLLVVVLLAVLGTATVFPRVKLQMTNWMAVMIAVCPLLLAIMYMLVVDSDWFLSAFAFLIDKGKLLSSRLDIWTNAFETIAANPILGAYNYIQNSPTHSQQHNTHLDIAASYGLPVLVMFIYFMYRVLRTAGEKVQGRMNTVCIMAFSAIMMTGISEAALVSGGMGIYIPAGIILMLSHYNFSEIKHRELA